MLKDRLKAIKEDMKIVRSNKHCVQGTIKRYLKEIETERKEALTEYERYSDDDWIKRYHINSVNRIYDRRRNKKIDDIFNQWHNDQTYHIIYKDGSVVVITAEEILDGAKFPKLSDIAYAELQSADDHFDTETGDLDFYSDERLEAVDYNYEAEDERKWQYEAAIQYKYNTEWALHWSRQHPDFTPIAIQ